MAFRVNRSINQCLALLARLSSGGGAHTRDVFQFGGDDATWNEVACGAAHTLVGVPPPPHGHTPRAHTCSVEMCSRCGATNRHHCAALLYARPPTITPRGPHTHQVRCAGTTALYRCCPHTTLSWSKGGRGVGGRLGWHTHDLAHYSPWGVTALALRLCMQRCSAHTAQPPTSHTTTSLYARF